jgi:hypothetical protein
MRDHRSSTYLTAGSFADRPELFRTVKLNAVGWAAVTGFCAAGAAAGLAAARLAGVPTWIAGPAGAAVAFAAVLVADRRRWANMTVSYSWTDDLTAVEHMAGLLREAGVGVSVDPDQPCLCYRHRDRRRIVRAFRDEGLEPPRRPR